MKRYKYQGMVTLDPQPDDGGRDGLMAGSGSRMVVRAQHRKTHASRFFSALVSASADGWPPLDSQVTVTMVVLGDDTGDYLAPGEDFSLWRGGEVGHGVITRRIFV
jgi:hypothetical protein